jgi:hypothetical protein
MEEIFYNKYKNVHITNNLNYVKLNELKIDDDVMLLSGNTQIAAKQMKFRKIIDNDILYFDELGPKIGDYISHTSNVTYSLNNFDESKKAYYYHANGKYINITKQSYNNHGLNSELAKHLYNLHKKNKKNKYISGKFIINEYIDIKTGEKQEYEVYSYLLFPTDGIEIKAIINIGLDPGYDLLVYSHEFAPGVGNRMPYFTYDIYRVNTLKIIESLQLKETKDIKWFNDFIMAKNYRIKQYIEDPNRDFNLKFVNDFLNINFNTSLDVTPVFENKNMNLKSYTENNRVVISWKDKIRSFNDGSQENFETQNIHLDGACMHINVNEDVSRNIEFQEWYKIAYDIANFKIEKQGINPKDGEYYINDNICSDYIIYKDYEGIITKSKYGDGQIAYIKKHGYFIKPSNREQSQDVFDRMKVMENLKQCK